MDRAVSERQCVCERERERRLHFVPPTEIYNTKKLYVATYMYIIFNKIIPKVYYVSSKIFNLEGTGVPSQLQLQTTIFYYISLSLSLSPPSLSPYAAHALVPSGV
jgi:hypothetical protein